MTAAVAKGVVLAGVDGSSRGFQSYTGGVFTGQGCTDRVDHFVAAVGYNNGGGGGGGGDSTGRHQADRADDAGGVGYWILQNSWGPDWGDRGYILLEKASNRFRSFSLGCPILLCS